MIFLVMFGALSIFCIAKVIHKIYKAVDADDIVECLFVGGTFIVVTIVISSHIIYQPLEEFTNLISMQEQVKTLSNNLETVKRTGSSMQANYKLHNFELSKTVNQYTQKFIIMKADYNKKLKRMKMKRSIAFYRIFGNGLFYPSAIDTMQYIY